MKFPLGHSHFSRLKKNGLEILYCDRMIYLAIYPIRLSHVSRVGSERVLNDNSIFNGLAMLVLPSITDHHVRLTTRSPVGRLPM